MDEYKRRINYKAITIFLILVVLIFIVLNIIKIPMNEKRLSTEITPYVVVDYYTAQEKYTNGTCVSRNFSYSYSWEGWDSGETEYTTPYLKVINYEDQEGIFVIQFAFFDRNQYPYAVYKDIIKWEDATMYSEERNLTLKPHGSNIISIPTLKPDPDASYWAIGDIKAPVLVDCRDNVQYKTVVKNRTITKNKTSEKVELLEKKVSIWDYIFGKS